VIDASFTPENGVLDVVYLWRKKKKASLVLVRIAGKVQNREDEETFVVEWVEKLMHEAYEGQALHVEVSVFRPNTTLQHMVSNVDGG